jgi:hypothetical protein
MQNIPKSTLQKNILKHIILTDQPDYQTISKEVGRDRITIRQSIESLSKIECIVSEPINPNKKKSKLIFRPTIKGLVIGLGLLDIKFEQIKNNAEKVTNLDIYKEFKKNMEIEQFNEYLKKFSIGLIKYDLINNNLNQLFSDSYTFVKFILRILSLDKLLDKDIDIENLFLFYSDEAEYIQNVKNVVPIQIQKLVKSVLVNIMDNLRKTINLLPE